VFRTPCANHYINLMLEDLGKISFTMKAIDQGSSITKYIYNRAFVLGLMKRFTLKWGVSFFFCFFHVTCLEGNLLVTSPHFEDSTLGKP
jgi:hypothetical protein